MNKFALGGAGLVIGHPLDTVKARLQTIQGYNGILDCFKKTFREESVSNDLIFHRQFSDFRII